MRLLGALAVVRIINAIPDEVFVIRIGGAAIHYTSFLLRILEPMVKNRRVEVLHEESGRCEELYDLSVRGFSPSRPPCESHVNLFVSKKMRKLCGDIYAGKYYINIGQRRTLGFDRSRFRHSN